MKLKKKKKVKMPSFATCLSLASWPLGIVDNNLGILRKDIGISSTNRDHKN